MKTNFALSLSFEGIRLLHRAAGGWRLVGDVSLESADMPADLALLRDKALMLEPDGLRTKVLLPNEQIKYLTIETADADRDHRLEAARVALDAATPYAVDDLAFDISADGAQTHVAAVAKETLAEAEGFAKEHDFAPVSFATIPGDQAYLGAPFFGETQDAATYLGGAKLEHDDVAVVIIGNAEIPRSTTPEPDVPAPIETVIEPEAPADTPDKTAIETPTDAPEEVAPDIVEKVETSEAAEAKPEVVPQASEETAQPEPPSETIPETKEAPPVVAATPAPAKPEDVPPLPTPPAATAQPPAKAAPSAGFASRRATKPESTPTLRAPAAKDATPTTAPPVTSVNARDIPPETPDVPAKPAPAIPAKADKPARAGFLSRRKSKAPPPPVAEKSPAKDPRRTVKAGASEAERMTIFGARRSDVGGKPRFLGLMLTAALLVFLAGVAAWASVFLDDGINLSRFFGERSQPEFSTTNEEQQPQAQPLAGATPAAPEVDEIVTANLDPDLSDVDGAVLDALRAPTLPPVGDLSQAELEAKYAATGIWSRAPVGPPEPSATDNTEDLYLTGIDPVSSAADAIALPAPESFRTDVAMAAVSSPAAAGTEFALNEKGLVVPTPQGTLSPDGVVVYLGRPAAVPPVIPTRFQTTPEDTAVRSALAQQRPQLRPSTLTESYERAQLDGLTRSELATLRPALRPKSIQERAASVAKLAAAATTSVETDSAVAAALAAPEPAIDNATKFAVRASVRPDTRPRNFARIVKRAERNTASKEVRVASAAAVAPRVVTPKIPSSASVARQATVKNAINLRKVNLIGVYGKASSRRALVRLGNGRYRKVTVGDRIDGGRVSAIGQSELRYTKGGRNIVLKMPKG